MLDIQYIRKNKNKVAEAAQNKNVDIDLDKLLSLDEQRRDLMQKVQTLREERNELAKSGDSEENRSRGREIKQELKDLESQLNSVQEEFDSFNLKVPNVTHPDMPVGKDEEGNVTLRTWGDPRKFDFKPKDHLELGEQHGIIDVKAAAKVSGARFYYLIGKAAQLQLGLINFVIQTLINQDIVSKLASQVNNQSDKPFLPIFPPVLMKSEVMKQMDRLDPIDDRFYLEKDDLVLVGSAEHTMGPLHIDHIFDEKDLPMRYVGYSTAFRREAGSYGKDTRGILRVHQFDKLEMETFSTVEQGEAEQDLLVAIQEYMLQQLEIPYQVVDICTGDTGKPDYRQIDIESWIPSQKTYRETHSADYMTDFQSRRLGIRYRTKENTKEFVYMNDATAFAIGRTLIAILENNQQEDGSITIPKVLQPLIGFDTI